MRCGASTNMTSSSIMVFSFMLALILILAWSIGVKYGGQSGIQKLIASFYINSAWAIGGAWPWLDYLFSVGLNLPSSHRVIQEFLRESFCCFADWELFRGVTEGSWAGWGWSTTGGCFWFCRPSWMFLILRRKYQWWMFQIPTRRGTELASNFSYINYLNQVSILCVCLCKCHAIFCTSFWVYPPCQGSQYPHPSSHPTSRSTDCIQSLPCPQATHMVVPQLSRSLTPLTPYHYSISHTQCHHPHFPLYLS